MKVTVSAVYTPVPGEDSNDLGPNEFTAGTDLKLNCTVEGNRNDLKYMWSVKNITTRPESCTGCNIDTSSSISTLIVGKPPLYSYYADVYVCTVNETSRPLSTNQDEFSVNVVGKLTFPFIVSFSLMLRCRNICSSV